MRRTPREKLARLGALGWASRFVIRYGVTLDEVLGRERAPHIVRVRHELWSVVNGTFGLGLAETGRLFDVHHTTMKHALQKRARLVATERHHAV